MPKASTKPSRKPQPSPVEIEPAARPRTGAAMSLLDPAGHRKYLTADERAAFLTAARQAEDRRTYALCLVLAYTGCRLSEALELTADRVDFVAHTITFESLKKRTRGIYRAVPVPTICLHDLDLVLDVRKAQRARDLGQGVRLFPFSRPTGWRRVSECMRAAGLVGVKASPKGLRHAFGVTAANSAGLQMARRWLGHSSLQTTTIYAESVGAEEWALVNRMWD